MVQYIMRRHEADFDKHCLSDAVFDGFSVPRRTIGFPMQKNNPVTHVTKYQLSSPACRKPSLKCLGNKSGHYVALDNFS